MPVYNCSRDRDTVLTTCTAPDTRPPVDLYCYYLFLQREGNEDSLDFWLDTQAHENLCESRARSVTALDCC